MNVKNLFYSHDTAVLEEFEHMVDGRTEEYHICCPFDISFPLQLYSKWHLCD